MQSVQAVVQEWGTFASLPIAPTIYTDYVVVGEMKSAA